jgi:mannose-6-phosphate isomerase-like protein (cupin superfamily)
LAAALPSFKGDGLPRFGDVFENKVTGEYAVVIRGDEDSGGEPGLGHLVVKPGGAVAGEHVHPHFQERFRVISGRLGARVDGVERTLAAGDEVTVPAGVPHDWWNAGDEDASVLVEIAPMNRRFLEMLATLFGLANAGKTNAKGMPNPLQLALIGREFSDVIVFTKPPPAVQKVAFGILGGLGRLRGYRGIYPEYLAPHGRVAPDPAVVALAG